MKLSYPQKWNGMYILNAAQIEDIAEGILRQHYPQVLQEPQATDIVSLASERLELSLKHRYFTGSGDVLGMLVFDDITASMYGEDKVWRQEYLESGTIIIDGRLKEAGQEGRYRFTVGHEAAHWLLHRAYHTGANQPCQLREAVNRRAIACRVGSSFQRGRTLHSDYDWEEWQADRLSAALLMPLPMFQQAAADTLREQHCGSYLIERTQPDKMAAVIGRLSSLFAVSHTSVRIRLRQIGALRSADID